MKRKLLILLLFSKYLASYSQENSNFRIEVDTIIEKNSPRNLDLEKHQLFIDTTRNSNYHKILNNWKKRYNEDYQVWTVIRKIDNNEFVIYDRSDGMDPIIQLNKKWFIFNGVHEKTDYQVKTLKRENDRIEITISENNRGFKKIEILSSSYQNISIIRFYGKKNYESKYWITKIENINYFDCLVNSYKYSKMSEYDKFIAPK